MKDALCPEAACSRCDAKIKARLNKDGGLKTPRGWVRDGEAWLCPKCRQSLFVTRAYRAEIIGPADSESRNKQEFYTAAWAASTACAKFANWYLQRLFAADPAASMRFGEKPKLPAMPTVDFYRDATAMFGDLSPRVLCQLAQTVRSYYSRERFDCFVRMTRCVRSYRWSGLPIPIPRQAWSLITLPDGTLGVSLAIGPGKNWKLKMRCDASQRAALALVQAGDAVAGAASLRLVSRELRSGESAGQRRKFWTLRIAVRSPRPKARQRHQDKVLQLGHDAGCLWVGAIQDDADGELWEFPAVRLKQRIVGHWLKDKRRQIDDQQQGRQLSRRARKRLRGERTSLCDKHQERVRAEIKLQIATLVGRCVSAGITAVEYDTSDRGWLRSFPWSNLQTQLVAALETQGIACHLLNQDTACARPMGETGVPA